MIRLTGLRSVALLALTCLPTLAMAAGGGGGAYMRAAENDIGNVESLQRGAKYYVNYCQGCHSAKYVRYGRVGEALEIDEAQLTENLMFAAVKPYETMVSSMPADDAKTFFGAEPPDLSLVARSRGVDWIFSYLLAFYADESRPLGVNNKVLVGASMPHVMWDLQGMQKPVYKQVEGPDGKVTETFEKFELVSEGSLSPDEYEQVVRDIVNFMAYMGRPEQLQREALGIKVVAFLLLFFLIAYALKREYWKEVH